MMKSNLRKLSYGSYSSENSSEDGQGSVFFLSALMVCLCILSVVTMYKRCRYRRHIRREQGTATVVKTQSRQERYEDIEKWLISKRVERHDELCQRILDYQQQNNALCIQDGAPTDVKTDPIVSDGTEDPQSKFSIHRNWSLDTADSTDEENPSHASCATDLEAECPICYDAIVPGDLVSWSPNPSCEHTFHHRCIKEWLLQHAECPFCRETFLPIDSIKKDSPDTGGDETFSKESEAIQSIDCYYCVQHGIVRPPPTMPSFDARIEWERILARAREFPDRYELTKLRGRKEPEEEDTMEEGLMDDGVSVITPSMTRTQQSAPVSETEPSNVVSEDEPITQVEAYDESGAVEEEHINQDEGRRHGPVETIDPETATTGCVMENFGDSIGGTNIADTNNQAEERLDQSTGIREAVSPSQVETQTIETEGQAYEAMESAEGSSDVDDDSAFLDEADVNSQTERLDQSTVMCESVSPDQAQAQMIETEGLDCEAVETVENSSDVDDDSAFLYETDSNSQTEQLR